MEEKVQSRILRLTEVKELTGLSRSTIYAYMKSGLLPKSLPLGARAVGWLESDIQNWINQKVYESKI